MTASVSPVAIDGFVHIGVVRVVGRHRKDLGDIAALAASISDVDLLNPITLTRDCRLVAGQRRLEACRSLGWDTIPVRFVDSLDDAAKLLRAERDENTERKEMLPSEKASLGEALYEIEVESARQRMALAGQSAAPGRSAERCGSVTTPFCEDARGKTRDIVGEVLGMDGRSYSDLRFVYAAANDQDMPDDERALASQALKDMDDGRGIQSTTRKVRGALRAKRDAKEAMRAAMADPPTQAVEDDTDDDLWMPSPKDSSRVAVDQRRKLIAHFADRGYSSGQISGEIGILTETVRLTARRNKIRIPADEALGRARKTIDSNRIVRETVNQIAGFLPGLVLVRFDELDEAEIKDWTASLSESIRALNRLNKQLKEMVQ